MERRQRPPVPGTWDRPRYGDVPAQCPPRFPQYPPSRSDPQHEEPQPRDYYPGGGAQRPGPWDSRPPDRPPQDRPEHRAPATHSRGGLPRPDVFPHGGPRPGVPHPPVPAGRTPDTGPEPRIPHRAGDHYGNDGVIHPTPEPPQYNAPHRGPALPPQGGRPPQCLPAIPHGAIRRETMRHEGPHHVPAEHHRYSEGSPPRGERPDPHQPDVFYQGGPGGLRGPDPELSHSHHSGRPPAGFQPDVPHSGGNLHGEGPQPGGPSPAGLYHPNTPTVPHAFSYRAPRHTVPDAFPLRAPPHTVPDAFQLRAPRHTVPDAFPLRAPPHTVPDTFPLRAPSHTVPDTFPLRAPSPGILPAPTPSTPYSDNPQQDFYHLPPTHGNPPNPPYVVPPLVGSAGFCESVEGDLGVPNVQGNTNPPHLLNQPSPGPLMSSALVGGSHFERDGPFLFQHSIPDVRRDPNLLLQHGGPFVSQPSPYIPDSFVGLDRQASAMQEGGPEEKDVFVQWLSSFLSCRRREPPAKTDAVQAPSIAEARGLIYSVLRLVSQLDSLCQALESHDQDGEPWARDYEKAAYIRVDLEEKMKELEKPGYIQGVKRKLDLVHKKRLRCQRRRHAAEEEEKEASERSAGKEAGIDLWRMQCIQKVEERKRERELKATADGVLGEVRKKQHDVKKMLDVLKSLEKLRKLRKEAAGRKGVCPPASADEAFTNLIKRLRTMVHKRSALYDAEEKTLRVILEGEQEEERQREKDKRLRKEKEKIFQKQRELDCILFGDTESLPSLHPLQPFRQYYLQAEHSVVSLVQIRHEWDQFLVPPDHPDGCSVPRGWVVPTAPCNNIWAAALEKSE